MAGEKEQDECLFCRIAKKEIPSEIVFETENVLAFLDINPVNKGHALVIPKKHFLNLIDLPEILGAEMIAVSKLIGYSQIRGLGAEGFNFNMNNFPLAGQLIMHAHFHVIPRFSNDGLEAWGGKKYEEGESKEILEKLKSGIREIENKNNSKAGDKS